MVFWRQKLTATRLNCRFSNQNHGDGRKHDSELMSNRNFSAALCESREQVCRMIRYRSDRDLTMLSYNGVEGDSKYEDVVVLSAPLSLTRRLALRRTRPVLGTSHALPSAAILPTDRRALWASRSVTYA